MATETAPCIHCGAVLLLSQLVRVEFQGALAWSDPGCADRYDDVRATAPDAARGGQRSRS